MLEFRKCHLFFSCGKMKFFLFLLFFLLLFDCPQGLTISHKRSIRAVNTTLETSFNGTYEKRNPCTNEEIEKTSYVASHEFRHHAEENNLSDCSQKCSSIINSFLQALGNLVHLNHNQSGIFNFHINTSISQKQDGLCEPGNRTSCKTLPTITIEATGCELSPNLSDEQLRQNQKKDAIFKNSLNEEIRRENKVSSEQTPGTFHFILNSSGNTPQRHPENEITSVPSIDAIATESGAKLREEENAWTVDGIFQPVTETDILVEPEFSTAGALTRTKNTPQEINDFSGNDQTRFQTEQHSDFFKPSIAITSELNSENYASSQGTELGALVDPEKLATTAEESFNEPFPSHSQYLSKTSYFGSTSSQPIADAEPFYPKQFSDVPFTDQQPVTYSKQLFDDNLYMQEPDSELSPNQKSDNSFILTDQTPKAPLRPQKPISTETYQPKDMGIEVSPVTMGQNEESFQQSLQSGRQPEISDEKTEPWPDTDISSETETTIIPNRNYLTEYKEAPFSQMVNAELPLVTPYEEQFTDYDGQTPASGLSANYPKPPASMPPIRNAPGNILADENSKEATKEKSMAIDYPDEFFKAQPELGDSLGSPILGNASYKNDQGVSFSDNLFAFNTRKPVTDPTSWTLKERSQIERPFDDANDNQFFLTTSSERPSFLTSESQKSEPYYSEEGSDESSTDNVTDTEIQLPSEQYQSSVKPESESLLNYSDQYDNVEEAKYIPESNFFDPPAQFDSELTTQKPYLQSYQNGSFAPLHETASPLQYSTSTQKFSPSYDSAPEEPFPPSGSDTFSNEYLTTLPPTQDSFENSQQDLTTFDPYQDRSSFYITPSPSAFEGKLASTFPSQILNEDAMSSTPDASTLSSEQSSNDIFTSPTSTTDSSDDYRDSLYSKPDIEPTLTILMPHFNKNTYEPDTEPHFANDENTYSDDSWRTTPTIFGAKQLKQQPLSFSNRNSDPTFAQPLNNTSATTLPVQNYETPELQLPQLLENSLSDAKPFSDFSTESTKTDSFMNHDSLVPQTNQYQDDNVLTSDQSEPNPDVTPYFPEGFPEENPIFFSPQSFSLRNDKDRSSFRNVETASSSNLNTADDYFEPTTAYSYQELDLPIKFPKDPDAKLKKFLPKIFTTPLPPFDSPSEGFSSSPNYKTTSENPPTQNQIEESSTSLEQFVDENLPPQFEEPPRAIPTPFANVKEFDSDFQTDENLKQPFELETTEEKPRKSSRPVYESPKNQPFSYSDATESLTPYTEKQYVVADQPQTSALSEYGSTTSEYQLTEEPAETELDNYNMSVSEDPGNLPVEDPQSRDTTDQESTLNHSNQFSDFYPKEASVDFFPLTEGSFNSVSSDSPEGQTELYLNNKQPSSVVFQPPSSVSAMGHDPSPTLEFQPSAPESQSESVLPFSDDKPLAIISGKTPLDISSPTDSLAFTNNKELQSHEFRSPSFVPDNQPQITSGSNFHPEDFSKDSQNSSIEDFDPIVSPESNFTKPEIFRNMNRVPNRQTATKFKTFQSPQRDLEIYDQLSSSAPLQSKKLDEGEIVPSNDYLSTLKSTSQIEPLVNDYNEQIFNPYSEPNLAPNPQPYQYQTEFSTPTLLEEYSDITPTPFDIEETTEPPVSEVSPLKINDQYVQEKMPEPSVAPQRQLKSQPSYDSLPDIPGGNVEEPIPSEPQTSDFDFKPDKSVARGLYERNSAGTDNYQPMPEELDYLDESLNTNLDEPTPGLSNYAQSSVTSLSSDLVPNVQFKPNDLSFSPQPPSSTSFQLNNISNKPSQQSSAISFRYPQSDKKISLVTDKTSPQSQQTTAVHNDEEIRKMSLTSKPQPQMSLNFADQFSDDNILKQLPDSLDQEYQITPDAVLPSEFEPVPSMNFPSSSNQRKGFSISDDFASNQPSFRSQMQQMDVMTGSADQTQNNFGSKQSFEAIVPSPPYTPSITQSQPEPSVLNQEHVFNSQEQFSPESQPVVVSNNRPISTEYQQDSSIPSEVYDRFPSKNSPQEQRYFNEDLPYSEAQRLRASRYGQQALNPREKFQPRPYITRSSRYPIEGIPINSDRNNLPSVASRHSATQKLDPQPYPINFPNQYPRPNLPISNSYNNRPSSQHFTSNAMQAENSFRKPLPFSLDQYPERSETEWSPDQTSKSANSPSYNDYDQALSSQLSNEKLLEYDEDFTPELVENSQVLQTPRHQGREMAEEDPREGSNDYLTEEDPPLGFNRKPDPYEFQDSSSPNNEPPTFKSPPAEKEPHSNPLFQALESHLTFAFQDHLRPSASHASFADTHKESLNDSFIFDPQNEFRNVSAIPPYSEGRDSELDFINYQQRPQSLNGVGTAQDVTNARQPDSFALVSDPNFPSNKPGEDCVSRSGQIPTPLSCPFDPIHRGNMTAPSYYIVVSKSPVDEDEEERFKVEKVYLGNGMPLNCTMSTGKTFPTSLYTPIPFAAAGTVKLGTESDFA